MRKKSNFTLIDLLIATIFSVLLCFFVLPFGVKYFLKDNTSVPNNIKLEILQAGKKYLIHNSSNIVTLNELYKTGYLVKTYKIDELNCFNNLTTVRKSENVYYLNLECSVESSTLSLMEK